MAIVINEIDVTDAPESNGSGTARREAPQAPQRTLLNEEDLRRLEAEMAEHALRLWSH